MNENKIHPGKQKQIESKPFGTPGTIHFDNGWYYPDEIEAAKQQQREAMQAAYRQEIKDKWLATEQGKLCMAFYEAFQAYKEFLEQHEYARRRPDGAALDFEEHKLFAHGLRLIEDHRLERAEKLRRNLEKAQKAARCQHHYLSGEQCGAPRVKGKKLCRMHERMEEAKTEKLDLGPMEDPDSIQVAIKKLQGAIIEGKLDYRQVGQLAYTIQLAAWNVTRTSMVTRE